MTQQATEADRIEYALMKYSVIVLSILLIFAIVTMDWFRCLKENRTDEAMQEIAELKIELLNHRHARHMEDKVVFKTNNMVSQAHSH